MSVYIFEGLPGNGKTLHLTALLLKDLRRGKHCYTNIDIDLVKFNESSKQYRLIEFGTRRIPLFLMPLYVRSVLFLFPRKESLDKYYHRIYDIEDLKILKNGQVYIDEIHLYFDARDWDKLDAEHRRVLAQHRHFGLNIWGTTQAMTRVENILRQLTETAFSIKKIIVFPIPFTKEVFGLFYLRSFYPKTLLDSGGTGNEWSQAGWGRLWFADTSDFAIYDTFQNVERPSLIGKKEMVEYTYVEKPVISKIKTGSKIL
jgi:hypothetical protein